MQLYRRVALFASEVRINLLFIDYSLLNLRHDADFVRLWCSYGTFSKLFVMCGRVTCLIFFHFPNTANITRNTYTLTMANCSLVRKATWRCVVPQMAG